MDFNRGGALEAYDPDRGSADHQSESESDDALEAAPAAAMEHRPSSGEVESDAVSVDGVASPSVEDGDMYASSSTLEYDAAVACSDDDEAEAPSIRLPDVGDAASPPQNESDAVSTPSSHGHDEQLSAYELARNINVARNEAMLRQLGLLDSRLPASPVNIRVRRTARPRTEAEIRRSPRLLVQPTFRYVYTRPYTLLSACRGGGSMALDAPPAEVEVEPLGGSMPLDAPPAATEEALVCSDGQSSVVDAEAPTSDVAGIRDVFTERQDELLECAHQCLRDVVLEAGDTPLDLKGLFERCTARARRAAAEEKAAPAATPAAVTSVITLRGAQLAYAVLRGEKRVENRHFSMRPGWYALHVGAKTGCHSSQEPLLQAVTALPPEAALPHGVVVGAVRVSHSLPLEDCSDVEPWAFGPVVNVIDACCRLETPVDAKGALSIWRLDPEAREAVQRQLEQATVADNDVSHLPSQSSVRAAAARQLRDVIGAPAPMDVVDGSVREPEGGESGDDHEAAELLTTQGARLVDRAMRRTSGRLRRRAAWPISRDLP